MSEAARDTFVQRLGRERLQVLSKLGEGGCGVVYRVRDRETGALLALKVLREATPRAIERFRREAELAASLRHPNVVAIHGAGTFEGRFFITYELVEGARGLDAAFEGAPLRRRLELLRDAARGLGHAHARGVVHRDVKPDNLLVDGDGRVRVIDFGLAAAEGLERLTRTGGVTGTPWFMAPEQVDPRRGAPTARTDVWALGVILHRAITDELPFDGESFFELARRITATRAAPPSRRAPDVPPALDALCVRALDPDPAGRPADGDAFADALEAALRPDPAGRAAGRRATVVALVLGGSALALIAAALSPGAPPGAPAERPASATPTPPAAPSPAAPEEAPPPAPAVDAPPPWELDEPDENPTVRAFREGSRLGDPASLLLLGGAYQAGVGVAADPLKALACYLAAAQHGQDEAHFRAGLLLATGAPGLPPDRARAAAHYEAAATAGHDPAMRALAALLAAGRGLPRDRARARSWFERAVAAGNDGAVADLAELLLEDDASSPDDHARARALLGAAAERGDRVAMRFFGVLLLAGRGGARDEAAGAVWIQRAARRGDMDARLLEAELFAEGRGVARDPDHARALWSAAHEDIQRRADAGAVWAMHALARQYEGSRWLAPDPARARAWRARAAAAEGQDVREQQGDAR
ncbi:MAG: serine/threonine-protein kinase [Planctomycetes bacterium]|nr:serine/threonine-protein kinase [Planctomycetota bacterium]